MSEPTTNRRAPQLKIGEVARQLGTTVRTLRYYEQEGLLTPPRSAKGTRLYGPRHVARFRAALSLTGLGLPLQDVIALTKASSRSPSRDGAAREVLAALEQLRRTAATRRAGFEQLLEEIERAAAVVNAFQASPSDTTGSPYLQRLDELPILALTCPVDD